MRQMRKWLVLVTAVVLLVGCGQGNVGPQTQQAPRQEGAEGQTLTTDRMDRQARLQQQAQGQRQRQQNQLAQQMRRTPDLAGGKERNVREPHPMTLADLHRKYPTTFRLSGAPVKRQVALTFDDGPDVVFTPRVLDVLKKHNVKATFFLVGKRVEAHPEVVKRMVREGHEVGNHSYSHANLPKLKPHPFHVEVLRTQDVIARHSGYRPKFIRPPYGAIEEEQIKWLASQGFTMVNWNVDSLDWKGLSADQVADNVLSNVAQGAIILQHSAGGHGEDLSGTIDALPKIIEKLKADGVSFVTVSQLLELPKGFRSGPPNGSPLTR
ncbi:polysaccharide deacetylase family protein [Brevibacillus humidisoli]|uniref:polysaccharide deacetylase family protein n=1 Tax=Brevibacillus humidisoli TaxID=2895522 RepID=UPI001E384F7F|nr:polysaccharide deacetylase family protein [Brevibacillus humidisoli]UFJ39848.1 polysaccharide deacetylase family protein [Brevibacillus humidisoli]